MHICHITEYCHAITQGGTERYILELIKGLPADDFTHSIGWICGASNRMPFLAEGIQIIPIKSPIARTDCPDEDFVRTIRQCLFDQEEPHLLHFHTFGMAEAKIAVTAISEGVPYAFTYHSPAWTCRRGSLLRWGSESWRWGG